jgi:hypothetical protein
MATTPETNNPLTAPPIPQPSPLNQSEASTGDHGPQAVETVASDPKQTASPRCQQYQRDRSEEVIRLVRGKE